MPAAEFVSVASDSRRTVRGVRDGWIVEFRESIDSNRRNPFARWFGRLSAQAAAKMATALVRMEQGNLSGVADVGAGVLECRIDFGPGCRVYFGKDGDALIILLGGGTRKRQQRDIEAGRNS